MIRHVLNYGSLLLFPFPRLIFNLASDLIDVAEPTSQEQDETSMQDENASPQPSVEEAPERSALTDREPAEANVREVSTLSPALDMETSDEATAGNDNASTDGDADPSTSLKLINERSMAHAAPVQTGDTLPVPDAGNTPAQTTSTHDLHPRLNLEPFREICKTFHRMDRPCSAAALADRLRLMRQEQEDEEARQFQGTDDDSLTASTANSASDLTLVA